MPTHNPPGEHDPHAQHGLTATGHGAPSPGYETSDVKVGGILVFLVSLGIFLVIFFVFCFGMGKVINNALIKHDGPPNKWNQFTWLPAGKGKNLESNAVMEQQQLRAMTARFPTPRLEMDDGNQDVADMHAREDLLLDHYTWINRQQAAVRIPIGRAMELIAQRGLPVAAGGTTEQLMTADERPALSLPLTNGFARTGYEQQLEVEEARKQESRRPKSGEQASLAPAR
jgi:hypothetical protein